MKQNAGKSPEGFVYQMMMRNVNCGLGGLTLTDLLKISELEINRVVITIKVMVFSSIPTLISQEVIMKQMIDQFAELKRLVKIVIVVIALLNFRVGKKLLPFATKLV